MSGIIDNKQTPVYLVIIFATLGSHIYNNSDDVITLDTINAIKETQQSIQKDIEQIEQTIADHKIIDAHPSQKVATEFIKDELEELDERLRHLERTIKE